MKIYILFVIMVLCLCAKAQEGTKPFVLGLTDALFSVKLNENRVLNIYLPEGYDPKDSVQYPVIYLLDGSADEDFIHVVGIVQYYGFEWINLLPKSIVVGIATVDRRRDFTFPTRVEEDKKMAPTSGHSDKFMAFIETELQPYVRIKYKASGSKMLIGQSLGGLLATEILFKKPHLFDQYVIVSPSLWWDGGSLLNYGSVKLENKDVYIGVGKEGLTPTQNPRVMEVDANVLADKVKKEQGNNCHVYFDYLPGENHATVLHQAVLNAFKFLFSNAKH